LCAQDGLDAVRAVERSLGDIDQQAGAVVDRSRRIATKGDDTLPSRTPPPREARWCRSSWFGA
jgi:hypothetical protein